MITFIKSIFGLSIIMILWVMVQFFWKKLFTGRDGLDKDALAERGGCGNCGCTTFCTKSTA